MVPVDSDRIPRVPPYSGYCYQYTNLQVRDYHPLRCNFPITSPLFIYQMAQSYNPNIAKTILVWAIPLSLATTQRIDVSLFSCRYLDVSVPCVGSCSRMWQTFSLPGCPIRISADQVSFANPRSFSQLTTSFVAHRSLGILRLPLSNLLFIVVPLVILLYIPSLIYTFIVNRLSLVFCSRDFLFY